MCIKCVLVAQQERVKKDPEKRKEQIKRDNARPKKIAAHRANGKRQREIGYTAEYQKSDTYKSKHYSDNHRVHDITKSEERALLEIFNFSCAYCGMTLTEHRRKFNQKLHDDHVDYNGYNDIRNDVPACKNCNCSKWKHPMKEWYESQEFYSIDKYNKIIWWVTEGYKGYIESKPPYRIIRKQNEGLNTYHFQLYTVDEKRNFIECIATGNKKKDLNKDIKAHFPDYIL